MESEGSAGWLSAEAETPYTSTNEAPVMHVLGGKYYINLVVIMLVPALASLEKGQFAPAISRARPRNRHKLGERLPMIAKNFSLTRIRNIHFTEPEAAVHRIFDGSTPRIAVL
jgi:hypothetical protein